MPIWNTELISEFIKFNPTTFENKEYSEPSNTNININMVYFLYCIIANTPCLIYVGQTARGFDRILEHMDNRIPFDYWRYISVPNGYLQAVELFYIQKCMPCLNYEYNPLYMRSSNKYTVSKEDFCDIRHRLITHINLLKERADKEVLKDYFEPLVFDNTQYVRFYPYLSK